MHIESMRIFCDLVETGTFSKAAELNYITQSAVSQQLQNLEKSLGRPLLERSSRICELTPAGKIFHQSARRLVASYEELLARIRCVSPDSPSRLHITSIYSVGTYVLQKYLKEFLRVHPDIKVEIDYQKASRICDDVLRGRCDLGILAYPVQRRDLQVIPLTEEELVLILPRRHPLTKKPSLRMSDLSGADLIAFDRDTPTRKSLDKILRSCGVRMRIRMELDNIEAIKSAVSSGIGISIVPEPTVLNESKSRGLCLRRFEDQKLSRPLGILVRKERREDAAIRAFFKHIK